MLGRNYFENRLGDTYQYSRIQYKCGTGLASSTEFFWELCLDICGNIIFVLSSYNSLQSLGDISCIEHFSGVSDDNIWDIACTKLNISSMETKVFQETVLFCLPRSIELTSKAQLSNEPNVARAYFSNFAFFRFDCERGFFANINSKKICFQMLKTHKQLIELIRIGRISNGILSFASIPINHDEDINSVEAEIDSVSWFSSLLSLNLTTAPIIEYYSNDKIVRYFIRDTARSSLNSSYYIVDNLRIKGGIPKAFDSCYQNYKILQTRMGINKVIDFLVEINQQKHIDIKLATTFMTYEYLLLKYLLDQGWTQDRIGDNIQKKLNQANKSLCIIPKTLKSDELRGSVRNPLFHQGEIPLLTLEEKIDLFEEYYDLLIQITLKIFDYNAQYMSIVTQKPSQITNIA